MTDLKSILRNYIDVEADNLSVPEIIHKIKQAHVSRNGERLTNFRNRESITIGDMDVIFDYKRDALKLNLQKNQLSYFGISENIPDSVPFLLNSGQAGINVCLFYIKNVLKLDVIELNNDSYIGLRDLMSLYAIKAGKSKILWICSSDYRTQAEFDEYDLVVIDSTCWSVSSKIIRDLHARFKHKNLLQIRSMSKLDMAGIEYGSLGSIIVNGIPADQIELILKLTGSAPSLDDIPPFFLNQDFQQFLVERNLIIEKNVDLIRTVLGLDKNFYFPEHRKYFFIKFASGTKSHEELIKLISKVLYFQGVEIRSVPSFGFDECVVSIYKDIDGLHDVIRISPGLIDPDQLARGLNLFLKNLK